MDRPRSVCRACQLSLPVYEATWWQQAARVLEKRCNELKSALAGSQKECERLQNRVGEVDHLCAGRVGKSSSRPYFVRDAASKFAHHWSYTDGATDTALCGYQFTGQISYEGDERPLKVCRQCEERVVKLDSAWWRAIAQTAENNRRKFQQRSDRATNELRKLQRAYAELSNKYDDLVRLQHANGSAEPWNRIRDPLLNLLNG
ncbi:hypothetical protein [Mycolicibacterium vaccae]|uniref:hypothetical protein n=1 Tax=Mycolicibacterium vaccae TaxID=1810 RepID=UPI001181C59D|nr:hypothetical protein [Mycolicibacterium vaccae]